ncbi:putative dihydrolipoyllysine-residue succinyltransferase [Rosa chinensis]|uniref:Putative dihydrolipoyllysine-residue succinyltransferase n=1 Tax=Rosa chinensis TaxID=74649 RepID=A0A2P6RS15_ROSCH|nr:putative dihydrolipoyllysine-residue succinyltransferase [Rosa chinensis]
MYCDSITDGTLATFLKKPGDLVEVDEPIAHIETDKVIIDVASPESGVIVKFVANEGDTVEPSTKIIVILKSSEGVSHVGPSEKTLEKDVPQPASPVETISKNQTSKVVITPVTEKPKAPSPPSPKPSAPP